MVVGLNGGGNVALEEILTPRLTLRHMSVPFYEACLRDARTEAEALLGLRVPPAWEEERELMVFWRDAGRADPAFAPWAARAIGLRATAEMIGHIGFHTRPDAAYLRAFVPDGIEMGYTIYPAHRRQGYVTEAVRGLLGWAMAQHPLRHVLVSISPANTASLALAQKLGFVRVGEHMDEVDGLEHVYLLRGKALTRALPDWLSERAEW